MSDQVPEGSGVQRKMEETGCKIICGAQTTFAVEGKMMTIIWAEEIYAPHHHLHCTDPSLVSLLAHLRVKKISSSSSSSSSSSIWYWPESRIFNGQYQCWRWCAHHHHHHHHLPRIYLSWLFLLATPSSFWESLSSSSVQHNLTRYVCWPTLWLKTMLCSWF